MRQALVIPGYLYGPHTPLLMFAAGAAEARGASIRAHQWDPPEGLTLGDRLAFVRGEVAPLLAAALPQLVIAKSLGTYAAPLAAEHDLPAVWLTPVLDDPALVEGLRRASAPRLLVGGTADPMWDGPLARTLSPYVCEIDGADHGMYVPGPLIGSVEVLGRVVVAVEGFLDSLGWPG